MKKMAFLFFLMALYPSCAQEFIHGKIVQSNSLEPLPFATVLLGKSGTISDENGKFSVKSNPKEGFIQVSYVGYKTQRVSLAVLKKDPVVEMEPSSQELLTEVKISNGADAIIRQVIEKYPTNYSAKPYSVIGTQWEDSRVGSKTNYYLEATLRGIILSTRQRQKHQIEILDLKWIEKDSMRKGEYMLWSGTGKLIEYFDLARMGREIFDSTQQKKFKFIVEDSYWNEEPCFKITCFRKNATEFYAESIFYVLKSTYAIPAYQYNQGKKSNNPGEAMVTYQQLNQRWYLNEIKTVQQNRVDQSTLSVSFKTTSLDTNARFDMEYGRTIQGKDVMLLSRQLRFYKNNPHSKSPFAMDSIPPIQTNRLKLFFYQRMRLLVGLGSPGFKYSEHIFQERIQSNDLQIDQAFQSKIPSTFPILFYFGSRIKLNGPWHFEIENSQNFKLGGTIYSSLALGPSVEFSKKTLSRPKGLFLNARFGSLAELNPIGEIILNSSQMSLLNFKANTTKTYLQYSKTFLGIGIGAFGELNRRRKIGLEFRFNWALSEKRFARLEDPTRISFFKKDYKIPLGTIEKGYPQAFQIILKIM